MANMPNKFAGLKIEHQQDELRISWPTLGRAWAIFFTPLALMLAFPLLLLIFSPDPILIPPEIVCIITLVTLFSLGLVYLVLLSLFNRSVVQVSQNELTVAHGPLPYASNKALASTNVKQVYIRLAHGSRTTFYVLYVLTRDNLHEKFLTVRNGKLALYLEEKIERFLGIEDQVVRGEWRPEPYLLE
ncbi:MAG: hypothetical protein GY832_42320 [Chloroflexi bacterium]|nr:hypothetical protein [Chloroflexota bacterium]